MPGRIPEVTKLAHGALFGLLFVFALNSAVGAHTSQQQTEAAAANEAGSVIYRQNCASCHDAGLARVPTREALGALSPENIRYALTKGKMSAQGATLTPAQIDAVVSFLASQGAPEDERSKNGVCKATAPAMADPLAGPHWNGWGVDEWQHRFQPANMAKLRPADIPKLKLKWAFGFPGVGQAYSQPAVVGGRVFVGSAARKVYSLDAASGCIYWVFDTAAPVRSAITVGRAGDRWFVYFGDQNANAYALDADTGKQAWKTHLENHPAAIVTGAPTLAGGKLFVPMSSYEEAAGTGPKYQCCKFRGSLSALDASSGELLWKTYTIAEEAKPVRKNKQGTQLWGPSGASIWSSPAVDLKHHTVYVTTGDSYSDPPAATSDAFLAFDSETGKLLWAHQVTAGDAYTTDCDLPPMMRTNCPDANGPDFDFGSSPILVDLGRGRQALIAGQKSGIVWAVDPARQGEVLWQTRVGKGGRLGGVQWGSAVDGKNVYAAVSDVGFLAATATTPGAQKTVAGVPLRLDPKAGGGLFALKLDTGKLVWSTPHPPCGDIPGCSPAQSAAVSVIPGAVFSGGLDGHLRAYSTADGQIIWDVDTEREYKTVNGVKGNGGAMDSAGPVIAGGMVFVNSGYLFLGGAPGNVLLAFSVDGK
ncbi:MAG TPA: PQQ-binding-like beta-propeller repeat protein [Blastocatellia bacterium]|nr:PQQ-binding-like beta-propeller repeat protein [Blastocatellia bacterium]